MVRRVEPDKARYLVVADAGGFPLWALLTKECLDRANEDDEPELFEWVAARSRKGMNKYRNLTALMRDVQAKGFVIVEEISTSAY